MFYGLILGKEKNMKPVLLLCIFAACSTPNHHPDMTASGAVVGGGIGAGAGAIIGHQLSYIGEGAGIGAGVGAVSGIMAGISADILESEIASSREQLMSIEAQTNANRRMLASNYKDSDNNAYFGSNFGINSVPFDTDVSSLKSGAISQVEALASKIRSLNYPAKVTVIGHADDSGDNAHNEKLSMARARTVAAILSSHGVSSDQIEVKGVGSTKPLLSNDSAPGRGLNRRVEIVVR